MTIAATAGRIDITPARTAGVVDFYNETADDFAPWSPAGNMHFGFCADGMNVFEREPQLARMNREVGRRLALPADAEARIADLGCGTGATTRQLLTENSGWHAIGISIVPGQVATARQQARDARLNHRATYLCEDFARTSFPAARFDGALAIESAVYGSGLAKSDFLREAKRLLRPGARLVVADPFFRDDRPLPPLLETCHRQMARSWAFDTLAQKPAFERTLADLGFVDIRFEDVSVNVLPSVCHVPGVTGRYLFELLRRPDGATPARRGHALAPLFAMPLGLSRSRLGYYLVSATRG